MLISSWIFPSQTRLGRKIYSRLNIQQYTTFNRNPFACWLSLRWFFMYNNKLRIHKREVIPHITDYMISVDWCQKNPSLILQLMTWHPSLDLFKEKNQCSISYLNNANILAAYFRWILVINRYTLLRFFEFCPDWLYKYFNEFPLGEAIESAYIM